MEYTVNSKSMIDLYHTLPNDCIALPVIVDTVHTLKDNCFSLLFGMMNNDGVMPYHYFICETVKDTKHGYGFTLNVLQSYKSTPSNKDTFIISASNCPSIDMRAPERKIV